MLEKESVPIDAYMVADTSFEFQRAVQRISQHGSKQNVILYWTPQRIAYAPQSSSWLLMHSVDWKQKRCTVGLHLVGWVITTDQWMALKVNKKLADAYTQENIWIKKLKQLKLKAFLCLHWSRAFVLQPFPDWVVLEHMDNVPFLSETKPNSTQNCLPKYLKLQ